MIERSEMTILIGADIVPTATNLELFRKGNTEELLGHELNELIRKADYRIFNLEAPLVDDHTPIEKNGPSLAAPTSCITGIKKIGTNLVTLSNNHILDQGEKGLYSTIKTLETANIKHLGAGNNISSARRPFFFMSGKKTIGVYACTEHEFSIAGEDSSGANPFDPLFSLDDVVELKQKCDYVIVLYHGGKEHYRYPSPNLQRICRRLIDKGANLVVCQHSHCIGCEEEYKEGVIVYGQGNFLFDGSEDECWKTSLLIQIDSVFNITYIPIVKYKSCVRLADKKTGDEIISAFRKRSNEIKSPSFVVKQYDNYSLMSLSYYLKIIKGKEPFLYRVVNKMFGDRLREKSIEFRYDKKRLLALRNWIECEAHNELITRGIQNRIKEMEACYEKSSMN